MGGYVSSGGGFVDVPDACLTNGRNAANTGCLYNYLPFGAISACEKLHASAEL